MIAAQDTYFRMEMATAYECMSCRDFVAQYGRKGWRAAAIAQKSREANAEAAERERHRVRGKSERYAAHVKRRARQRQGNTKGIGSPT